MNFLRKIKSGYYRIVVRGPRYLEGALKGNAVRAYWYRDIKNFGDLLTPALLRHFGFTPVHTSPVKAEMISVGSILEHVAESFSGTVIGSGFIHESSRMDLQFAQIQSVRGPLTRERLSARHRKVSLGDPGLLAPLLLSTRPKKRFIVGVLPHHANLDPAYLSKIATIYRHEIKVINVMDDPICVIKKISECEHILSSSLHGLIVADALGIPNAWVEENSLLGGGFKFYDYYASLGVDHVNPVHLKGHETLCELTKHTSIRPQERIFELQNSITNIFENLRKNMQ